MAEENPLPLPRLPSENDLAEAGFMDVPVEPEIDMSFTFDPGEFEVPQLTDIPISVGETTFPTGGSFSTDNGNLEAFKDEIIEAIHESARLG